MESKEHEVADISPSLPLIQSILFRENEGAPLKAKDYQIDVSGSKLEGVTTSEGKAGHENIENKELKIKLVLSEEKKPSDYPDNPGPLDPLDLRNQSDGGKGPVSSSSRTGESDLIKRVQSMLKALGYNIGTTGSDKDGVDGTFGDNTENAVKLFRRGMRIMMAHNWNRMETSALSPPMP